MTIVTFDYSNTSGHGVTHTPEFFAQFLQSDWVTPEDADPRDVTITTGAGTLDESTDTIHVTMGRFEGDAVSQLLPTANSVVNLDNPNSNLSHAFWLVQHLSAAAFPNIDGYLQPSYSSADDSASSAFSSDWVAYTSAVSNWSSTIADTLITQMDLVGVNGLFCHITSDDPTPAGAATLENLQFIGQIDYSDGYEDLVIIGSSFSDFLYGGGGVDAISGGSGSDFLMGNGGNDFLQGGDGFDSALYLGPRSDYTITANGDGSFTVAQVHGDLVDGVDTVSGIEGLVFADQEVLLTAPTAPSAWTSLGNAVVSPIVGSQAGRFTIGTLNFAEQDFVDYMNGQIKDVERTLLYQAGNTIGLGAEFFQMFERVAGLGTLLQDVTTRELNLFMSSALSGVNGNADPQQIFQDLSQTATSAIHDFLDAAGAEVGPGSSFFERLDAMRISIQETPEPQQFGAMLAGPGDQFFDVSVTLSPAPVGNGLDLAIGGDGSDLIVGGGLNEQIDGGSGNDVISGGGGNDVVNGGDGIDVLFGDVGDDAVNGGDGNDVIGGGDGNDTLDGGAGADTAIGGLGNDTFVVETAGDVITELASQGTDTVRSSITWTLGASLENLTLTGATTIDGTGNTLNNLLTGNDASNILNGKTGDDVINAAGGADTLYGGDGADQLNGGVGVDFLDGGNHNDSLSGGDDNDTLYGRAGNDTLEGGLGADTMFGGAGDDTYIVDNASDAPAESSASGNDTIMASVTYGLGAYIENLTLTGVAAINGTGNILANTLTGNDGANVLSGLAGFDTLFGMGGDDTLNGGNGNDTLSGGLGNDILDGGNDLDTLNGGDGNDTLYGRTSADTLNGDAGADTLYGGDGNDILNGGADNDLLDAGNHNDTLSGGAGDDTLYGRQNDDTLHGDAGTDTLYGGDGVDTLSGGTGVDVLNGGNGNDTFTFAASEANGDTIQDFNGLGAAAGDQFVFSGYGLATNGASFIQLDPTHWQINSADGTIHDVITLANGASVDASDYVFGP